MENPALTWILGSPLALLLEPEESFKEPWERRGSGGGRLVEHQRGLSRGMMGFSSPRPPAGHTVAAATEVRDSVWDKELGCLFHFERGKHSNFDWMLRHQQGGGVEAPPRV